MLWRPRFFEVVLTDLRMSGDSGMSVIDYAIKHTQNAICIMMTAYGEVDLAVEAMKRGAFDFLSKPVNLEKLELLIMRGLNEKSCKKENHDLHKRLDKTYSFDGILGKSLPLKKYLNKYNWWDHQKQLSLLLEKLELEKN